MTAHLHPPLRLARLEPTAWESGLDEGRSLASLAAQIATDARRAAKGLGVAALRPRLLVAARQVEHALRQRPGLIAAQWDVPAGLLPAWHELLRRLARVRAHRAAAELGKEYVLPFLPCLFPPSNADPIDAGAYGPIDTLTHAEELRRQLAALKNPPAEASGRQLVDAVRQRLEFFLAAGTGAGVVEIVPSHLP
jgi:hypothetical protein